MLLALRLPSVGDVELEGFCPACSSDVEAWEPGPGGRPRASCPICGSLERHRFLALTLQGLRPVLTTATHLLDAAPQPQVERVVRSLTPDIAYVRTDLLDLRWADVCADAVELPFVNGTFDLIIHFHVFEHIPDDRAAMREVARVLRTGGLMICQVPQRRGMSTDEDFTLTSEENEVRFGRADHVRWYGDDFEDRLRESGLTVISYTAGDVFDTGDLGKFNIPAGDRLWFCSPADTSWLGGGANREVARLRNELIAAQSQYERLLSRKVVRAGLALARLARPMISTIRRIRWRASAT